MSDNNFHGDGVFEWQFVTAHNKELDENGRPIEENRYHFDAENQWGGFSKDPEVRNRPIPGWAIAPFEKYEGNPVFSPDPTGWDCGRYGGGVHNGAVVKKDGKMYYVYRAEFDTPNDPRLEKQLATGIDYHCDIGVAVSEDGKTFTRVAGPLFRDEKHFVYSYEDVCIVDAGNRYYIYLNQWDWANFTDPAHSGIIVCESEDLIHWKNLGLVFPDAKRIHRNPCVLQDADNHPVRDAAGRYVMYIDNNLIAFSDDLVHWTSEEIPDFMPGGECCFALSRGNDIILFTGGHHSGHFYAVGEILLSRDDPKKPIEWLEKPVLAADPEIPWEDGKLSSAPHPYCSPFSDTIFFTGLTLWDGKLHCYYGGGEFYTCLATAPYTSVSD